MTYLFLLPYFLLIIVGMLIPSVTYRGWLNPKTIAFCLAGVTFGLHMLFQRKQLKVFFYLLASLTFLTLWFLIGLFDNSTILDVRIDQLKVFLLTIAVPIMTFYWLSLNKISTETVYKTVIYANMTYCALKVLAVILHLFGLIDIWELLGSTGAQIMSMAIFGELQRLQSSLDISTPFILFFVLQSSRLGIHLSTRTKAFYICVSLLSNFLAFSRFLLFIYFASVALYFFTLSMRSMIKGSLGVLVAMIALISVIGVENVATSIENRFFSKASYASDQVRIKQIKALFAAYEDAPYFGKGLGAYAKENIRDPNVKHLYEVQWMAFLMQFGLFGLIILIAPLFFFKLEFSFLCLFVLWILSGFMNPFLISLQSGIIYTLFIMVRYAPGKCRRTSVAIMQ